jgi:hypothetical protein
MEGERFPKDTVAEIVPSESDGSYDQQLSDVLKKTDEQLRLEQDIAALIGNTNMPDHRTSPPVPREAPDSEHMRMNQFIEEQQKTLNNLLDQAYTEQSWWNDRVRSLERVRDAVSVMDSNLNAPQADTTSTKPRY